jgi:hypothetical protein
MFNIVSQLKEFAAYVMNNTIYSEELHELSNPPETERPTALARASLCMRFTILFVQGRTLF